MTLLLFLPIPQSHSETNKIYELNGVPYILEDEVELKPELVISESIAGDIKKRLKLGVTSQIRWVYKDNTNLVDVQTYIIKDKQTGCRAFFINLQEAINTAKNHCINYNITNAVTLNGSVLLRLKNIDVNYYTIQDNNKNKEKNINTLNDALNAVNNHNSDYHRESKTYPVILKSTTYINNVIQPFII
jgi:hypothetical protein